MTVTATGSGTAPDAVTAPDSDVVFSLMDVGSDSVEVIAVEVSAVGVITFVGETLVVTLSDLCSCTGVETGICESSLSPDGFDFDDMRD